MAWHQRLKEVIQLINEDYLVNIAKEFASNVFATSLFVVKDTGRGGLEAMLGTTLQAIKTNLPR
jgi:hypothetical protein